MPRPKKEHLSVDDIYKLQYKNEPEIEQFFEHIGHKQGAKLFRLMIKSFNLAAVVAKAAWGYVKACETKGGSPRHDYVDLQAALSNYSPDNFDPPNVAYEFAAECFEQFYNEAAMKGTKEEVEELLFQWTARLREKADQPSA